MDVIKGPAIVKYSGVTYYAEKEIVVSSKDDSVDVSADAYGVVDSIRKSLALTIKFTPLAFSAAVAAALWPYATKMPGALLCGSVDTPLVIHTFAGQTYTYHRACLSKMPSLNPSLDNPLIGDVEFTAFPASDKSLSDDNSVVTTAALAFTDTSFDPDTILRGPWTVTYGGTAIDAETGVQIDFGAQTTTETTIQRGAYDLSMSGLKVTASFTPVGVGHDDWIAMQGLQGSGNGIGSRARTRGKALSITTTGFALSITKMVPTSSDTQFGADKKLNGQIQLTAARTLSAGALQPLWTIGTGA